jgi:hypothetical protein
MMVKYSRPGAACHITPVTVTVGVAKRGERGAKRQINQAKNLTGTHLTLAGVQQQTKQKDPGGINHLVFVCLTFFSCPDKKTKRHIHIHIKSESLTLRCQSKASFALLRFLV